MIRFRNTKNGPRDKRFLRGYGFQGGGRPASTGARPASARTYKKGCASPVTTLGLGGFGECLPRFENFVEIDPGTARRLRHPGAEDPHDAGARTRRRMIPDMAETAAEMLEAAGAKNIRPYAVTDRVPGYGIHEMGVARMGDDPKKSVLNQFQQAHDVKNLFVMDGSGFTSSACQNPTLTIMALAVRSTDYLLGEMKRGNL